MAQVKPITPGASDLQGPEDKIEAPKYVKAASGRVFEATPELIKQYRKGKFGLVKISESEFLARQKTQDPAISQQSSENAALIEENAKLKADLDALMASNQAPKKLGRPPKSATSE